MPAAQTNISPDSNEFNSLPLTELMIHYIEQDHLNITQVADKLNVNKSTVSKRLKKANYIPGYLKNLDRLELSLLKQARSKYLNHLATADIKKVSPQAAATTWAILTDKQLLLEGKPNSIVAYADLVKAQEIVRQERRAFESKYGITQADSVS